MTIRQAQDEVEHKLIMLELQHACHAIERAWVMARDEELANSVGRLLEAARTTLDLVRQALDIVRQAH
jgi:hypothetical protein